jgi:hypothetical protein
MCSAATARRSCAIMLHIWAASSVASSRRSRRAGHPRSAVMSRSVATAGWCATPTIPAATGTVRSAKAWHVRSGSRRVRPSCCRCPTTTWSSLPAAAAEIAFQNKRVVYAILFRAAADALRDIAADPRHLGAEIGAVAVLHTWGQALHHHPHLHCIVPSGGLSPDQTSWISCRPGFFLPVRVLSRRFRRLFLGRLQAAFAAGELRFSGMLAALTDPTAFAGRLADLRGIEWVVYAKRPFAGPQQVLAYLGRYTHRVALANSRLIRLANGQVSFTWKDYRREGETKVMTLAADEFMRRFLLHAVPDGFHRIRHLGFLANGHRAAKLALCRALLAAPTPEPAASESYRERHYRLTGHALDTCPDCGGPMRERGPLPRPPPRRPFWCNSS